MNNDTLALSVTLVNKLLNKLAKRPYEEVFEVLSELDFELKALGQSGIKRMEPPVTPVTPVESALPPEVLPNVETEQTSQEAPTVTPEAVV